MELPEALFTVAIALWALSLLLWGREEYWSVTDPRARFLPGTRIFHTILYRGNKPLFKRGVKKGPSINAGN
jgi:hypothetical protein